MVFSDKEIVCDGVSICSFSFQWFTELEWKLSETGAVKTDIEENPWKKRQIQDALTVSLSGKYRDPDDSDEDSD